MVVNEQRLEIHPVKTNGQRAEHALTKVNIALDWTSGTYSSTLFPPSNYYVTFTEIRT